jgi:dienelactone hydrolase
MALNPLSRREVIKFGAFTTAADVKAFEAELRKTNPNVEFVLYKDAPHAFFSDDRPQVYKKEAAEDAWKRCLAFFDKHLTGGMNDGPFAAV